MNIDIATLEDVDTLIALGNSMNKFQVSNQVVTFWPKNVLIDCIKSKNNPVLVAKENKQIVGFVIANYNPYLKKAIIENIFVKSKYRNKKIGESLLKALLEQLLMLKCEYVCSLVEEKSNTAVDFYTKNGFSRGINCVWLDIVLGKSFKR